MSRASSVHGIIFISGCQTASKRGAAAWPPLAKGNVINMQVNFEKYVCVCVCVSAFLTAQRELISAYKSA